VVHGASARFRGSPFIRPAGDPIATVCSRVLYMPAADRVLGADSFNSMGFSADNATFVELYNRSSQRLHLGGLRLDGVDFTFGAGSYIAPTGYVVVAGCIPGYQLAYTNAEVVVGEWLDEGGDAAAGVAVAAGVEVPGVLQGRVADQRGLAVLAAGDRLDGICGLHDAARADKRRAAVLPHPAG